MQTANTNKKNIFHVNNQMQPYECLPGETVWRYEPLSLYLNNTMSPPLHDGWPFTSPSSEAIQNNYKHFWLLMSSDSTSYKLFIFEQNAAIRQWWLTS